MNEDDFGKTDKIAVYIQDKFPGVELERDRDVGHGVSAFYLNINVRERMILKITDECVMDNDFANIRFAIERRCIAAMQANINQQVILYNDLHVEIRDPR